MKHLAISGVLVLTALLLAGCGGGSGGGSGGNGGGGGGGSGDGATAPVAATLGWVPASVKLFGFTWDDVTDATEYRLLENPDGSSGYTQVASIAPGVQNHDLAVFLPARVNASYILSACNAVGCTDSPAVFVSGNLAPAVGYVKASNTQAGDEFGYAVTLSGDGRTLAVGARLEDSSATGIDGDQADTSVSASGAVYVYARRGGVWSQQAYVKASNTGAGDWFGSSVALSGDGNTLAVGAFAESSNATGIDGDQANNLEVSSGAVYIYTRNAGVWSQQAYVKASNTGALDRFGGSVALSGDGNTLAVGAVGEDSNATGIDGNQGDNSAISSGAVYVYTRSSGVWSQQAYMKASNTGTGDEFGYSVALSGSGNTLAVGAAFESSNATGIDGDQANNLAVNSGAAYVFRRDNGAWRQQAYVKASNTGAGDRFGYSVALSGSGNTLAVGATFESSNATGIDGDQTDNSADRSGAVYVYTQSGGVWTQQAYVKASNAEADDWFGYSVALSGSGNILAVGAAFESSNATGIDGNQSDDSAFESGAVYVYTRNLGVWSQQAYVKASNTGEHDNFGGSVALSLDGHTLAVGAQRESSNATGIDGDQADNSAFNSGAVYLY